MMQSSQEQKEIALCCRETLGGLNRANDTIKANKSELSWLTDLEAFQDEIEKLSIWANNIGALHESHKQSSLDHRLKHDSDAKGTVLKFLNHINDCAHEVYKLASGEQENLVWTVDNPEFTDIEQMSASSENSSDLDQPLESRPTETTSILELYKTIQQTIKNLFRLSMAIRNVPIEDDYDRASASYGHLPSDWDIRHVYDTFPALKHRKPWLADKMGRAITQRKRFLKYRTDHAYKMSAGALNDNRSLALTKATSYHPEANTPIEVVLTKTDDDSDGSQTSYAPTAFDEAQRVNVPKLPKEANYGDPFVCPYCSTVQIVRSRNAWKRHVFHDLRPYVCTFSKCEAPLFTKRREWFQHELDNHRKSWSCIFCKAPLFHVKQSFVRHLQDLHSDKYDHSSTDIEATQLNAISTKCEEAESKICRIECPFMCESWVAKDLNSVSHISVKLLRRHIGRHLEQLALSALSPNGFEEPNSDDHSSGAEESSLNPDSGEEDFQSPDSVQKKQTSKGNLSLLENLNYLCPDCRSLSNEDMCLNCKKPTLKLIKTLQKFRKKEVIIFKDAVGRKHIFPFQFAATWGDMQDLIKRSLLNVDIYGLHVAEGHYDLMGPDDSIILPSVWDHVIKPNMEITMLMWPMPEPKPPESESEDTGHKRRGKRSKKFMQRARSYYIYD